MKVLFRKVSLRAEKLKQWVNTPKLTMLLKLLKKRKNCSDMEMNLTARLGSVKKKSRLWLTPLTI